MTIEEEFYTVFEIEKVFYLTYRDFKEIYLTISLQIERELEEILLMQEPKRTNKFIEYSINTYGEYVIRFRNTIKNFPDVKIGKTRQEALLSLCMQDEIKDKIFEQVQAIFKGGI